MESAKATKLLSSFDHRVAAGHACGRCWQPPLHCVCQELAACSSETQTADVVVLQHYKEFGNSSNTANLLTHVLPECCRLLVYPLQLEELDATLRAQPAVLLYPGEGSVPCEALKVQSTAPRLTLLLLDGTWRCVKAMRRRLMRAYPNMTCVSVSEMLEGGTAAIHAREETRPGAMCTAEATAQALRALGEHAAAPVMDGLGVLTRSTANRLGVMWDQKMRKRRG